MSTHVCESCPGVVLVHLSASAKHHQWEERGAGVNAGSRSGIDYRPQPQLKHVVCVLYVHLQSVQRYR